MVFNVDTGKWLMWNQRGGSENIQGWAQLTELSLSLVQTLLLDSW